MNPLALIPYALAAYGGIQGYQGARQQGVGGLGSLVIIIGSPHHLLPP